MCMSTYSPCCVVCVCASLSLIPMLLLLLLQVPGGHGYDHNYVLFGMGPQAKYITRNQAATST